MSGKQLFQPIRRQWGQSQYKAMHDASAAILGREAEEKKVSVTEGHNPQNFK